MEHALGVFIKISIFLGTLIIKYESYRRKNQKIKYEPWIVLVHKGVISKFLPVLLWLSSLGKTIEFGDIN